MGQLLKHSPIHVLEVGPANDARLGRVAFGFDRHLKVDVEVVLLTVPKIGQGLNILKKNNLQITGAFCLPLRMAGKAKGWQSVLLLRRLVFIFYPCQPHFQNELVGMFRGYY